MATPPKPTLSASEISSLRAAILLPPHHWATDKIDMDHIFQLDAGLAKRLMAQRLETQSEIHRAIAEGSAKAAALLK